MRRKLAIALSFVAVALAPIAVGLPRPSDVSNLSFVTLLSRPSEYDGRAVRTVGVAVFEFESSALYLTQEHADRRIRHNAIWLDLSGFSGDPKILSGRYVEVEGVFDIAHRGHLGGWLAAIRDISSITSWGFCDDGNEC